MGLYGIKDAGDLTFYSRKTGKPVIYMDYANKFEINITADSVNATKKGVKAITWDLPKEGTITIETKMASNELFAFLLKSELQDNVTSQFRHREVFKVGSMNEVVTIKNTPKDNNLVFVQKLDTDEVTSLGMLDEATADGTSVTLQGANTGDTVAVYYITEKESSVFTVVDDSQKAQDYTLVATTTTKGYVDGSAEPIEITVFKCAPQANATFTFDATTPSTFNITLDIMADEANRLFDMKPIAME